MTGTTGLQQALRRRKTSISLSYVTPLILTFNEEANIQDTLSRLDWAERIVVVDSHSTDATLDILADFPNVDVYFRSFDNFAAQCNFGLSKITTEWVLSLDADYKCPDGLPGEIKLLDESFDGYMVRFKYGIFGKPLRASLYPPRVVLYRTHLGQYRPDGHAHRVEVAGRIGALQSCILHDDRKPLTTWLSAQARYAEAEAEKLEKLPHRQLGWKDRIRRSYVLAPILTLLYCLIARRLILDGWSGWYYTLQRVYAEVLLSLVRLDRKLRISDRRQRDVKKNSPTKLKTLGAKCRTSLVSTDYSYTHAEASHTNAYLWQPVLSELESRGLTKVFDLGCGNGALARFLFDHGLHVSGVDPSETGIAVCNKSAPQLRLEVGSAYDNLREQFGSFPAVVSLEVVEHVYYPRKYAACIYDLLEPGGIAMISTPYHGYLKNVALSLTGKMDRHFTALWDHGHIKFWSPRTISELLTESGFQVRRVLRLGRLPALAKSMLVIAQKEK